MNVNEPSPSIQIGSLALRSVQMGRRWQVGVGVVQCGCGMLRRVNNKLIIGQLGLVENVVFSPDGEDTGK